MLTISEFSKATGLSIKALRLYHDAGVLVPSLIDKDNGYRYYDFANVERARVVVALRSMMFSIDQIAALMRDGGQADLLGFLEAHRAQIEAKLREMRQAKAALDLLIRDEQEAAVLAERARFDIEETRVEPLLVAGIRIRGRYSDSGKVFAKLGRELGRKIAGRPLRLHYDVEYVEDGADFECCLPVAGAPKVKEATLRQLAGGRAVTLLHQGPYAQLGRSYAKLFAYLNEHGHEIAQPLREVYLKGPGLLFKGNPKHYLTQIQAFVEAP